MQNAKSPGLSGPLCSGLEDQAKVPEQASMLRIKDLLKAKDDTSRFVGLALLKSVLDNTPELQQDGTVIRQLWEFIPGKFLDRLLRAGSSSSPSPNSRDMLDLAAAVIHTFTLLLPEESKHDDKLIARIPMLCYSILPSSENTTVLILQALLTLASHPEGAKALSEIEDLSSLVEIAPTQPLVLDVLSFAFLGSMATTTTETRSKLAGKVEQVLADLVRSFTGTDAVTLLDFLADFLRRLDEHFLPRNPPWLSILGGYIRNLTSSRPTPAARSAYVNLAATLVHVYPIQTPNLLFADAKSDPEKPFSYMLINLLLIDLRASFPSLLEQLNSPGYQKTARRLASDFDVVSCYTGFLMRSLFGDNIDEGPRSTTLCIPPDLLLKFRKAMSETMSVTIEFLRDRWDASVAGVMGLHPDARAGQAKTSQGCRLTIAWDSIKAKVGEDVLVLSAIRCLAVWLREDDNELLRREAMGLLDMLLDLYQLSGLGILDFRRPVLVALEGIMTLDEAPQALLSQDGWKVLTGDILSIPSLGGSDDDSNRGTDVVRILLPIVENERPGSKEEWLDLTTAVAAWDVLGKKLTAAAFEFYVAVLQLVTSIIANTHPTVQSRYKHTANAISGLATQLKARICCDPDDLNESLQDILDTIAAIG